MRPLTRARASRRAGSLGSASSVRGGGTERFPEGERTKRGLLLKKKNGKFDVIFKLLPATARDVTTAEGVDAR